MNFGFLGVGQGGSSVADLAAREGIYSAAINFSQSDLNSLKHIQLTHKLIGSEGVGKQRQSAISLMQNNWDSVTNFVKENFSHSSIEIIFVPFASAGGSGSGVAPVLLQLLTELMPEKCWVAMPIMPSSDEVYTNQRNCLEAFEDLSQSDICILPIDNDKAFTSLHNVGKSNLYKSVNEYVVSLIIKLFTYTKKQSELGVLDEKDLRSIFSTKGLATIGQCDLSKLTELNNYSQSSITEFIQQSWNDGFFADIETNQIISSGFIFDGQEALLNMLDVRRIFQRFPHMPINLFEGYYSSEKGSVLTVLSGMSMCVSRLKKIEDSLDEKSKLVESLNNSNYTFKSKLSTPVKQVEKPKQTKDISSIINRFKR